MTKKYTVHYMTVSNLVKPKPISDLQLQQMAEKTRFELEEKVRRRANGELPESDENEVITKWV